MRRRVFFTSLLGFAGAVAVPLTLSAETVAGEEFNSKEQQYCPVCDFAMWPEKDGTSIVFSCCNGPQNYSGGFHHLITGEMRYVEPYSTPGCPRFGIKYRAPKVKMERVS